MAKPVLLKKLLVRKEQEQGEDRGTKAPVLLARPSRLAQRLSRMSRGYVLAGAGVVVAAVGSVSLLSWLAPESDRPIANPLEVVERILPGVLEQVDDQVAALLGTDGETALRDVRESLTAAGSRIPWAGEKLRESETSRSASAGPAPSTPPALRSTSNVATPAREGPSSPTASESSPTSNESTPPSGNTSSPPTSTAETAPPATDSSSPTTPGEAVPPPLPAAEGPPAPPVEEPAPPVEEPPTEAPPATPTQEPAPPAEEPPAEIPSTEETPPTTDEPAPPPTEEPPPTTDQPPPIADQPPPPPQPPRGPAELAKG